MKLNSILLIEDDDLTASLYHMLLTDLNVSNDIIIKTDSDEGLDYILNSCLKKECPDIIFIDIKMPGTNGFEVIEEVKRLKKEYSISSIIVILTSSSFVKDIDRAKDLNVDDYLLKPLNKEKVYHVLRKYFTLA